MTLPTCYSQSHEKHEIWTTKISNLHSFERLFLNVDIQEHLSSLIFASSYHKHITQNIHAQPSLWEICIWRHTSLAQTAYWSSFKSFNFLKKILLDSGNNCQCHFMDSASTSSYHHMLLVLFKASPTSNTIIHPNTNYLGITLIYS